MNALTLSLFALVFAEAQVPPPTSEALAAEPLRRERRALIDREAADLKALATRLEKAGDKDAAAEVSKALPDPPPAEGSERFSPVPEVVAAREPLAKGAPAWRRELQTVRTAAAKGLFDLAVRAAVTEPRPYALADACLRDVISRDPDHAETRRLLGQVPHHGGWATPYAVRQFRDGKVPHPVYGWVKAAWVPHLTRGELPAPGGPDGRETWLPAERADALRGDFARGWKISTEHFLIQTNVPLSEAIAFGRHLETLHEVFESVFADVIGESSPLAQRFRNKAMVGERAGEPHSVSYFADREGYADAVRVFPDVDSVNSLGYYHPPQTRGSRRGKAYFFRDEGGDLEASATLFHEASHMLLFESGVAPASAFRNNNGNFWVFEGLGTYFETLTIDQDGRVRIGGYVGPRNEEARRTLVLPDEFTPLPVFVGFDQGAFNTSGNVVRHYQQASALAAFFMHGASGKYREGFLSYVKDACLGRLRRTSGRTLEVHLETTLPELQTEFLDDLKTAPAPGRK